ncbi:MAG: dihydrofolate synthase / folylpolyglutamate synthase, partial [Abditibacteriota bacterium]|nr:dihydrofolate synthase / folylpolyglutamate synthase [Abditibacteriota bacterium]
WNERIRIVQKNRSQNGPANVQTTPGPVPFPDAISDANLELLFQDALAHLEAVTAEHGTPTEFETLTFMGLWHFARQNVDAAVIEVGLGGRWDATNVNHPIVSVVTHVALDHCDRLGNTLEAIARDKVEIARPGCILVSAETKPQILEIFREHCDRIGAKLWSFRAPAFQDRDAPTEFPSTDEDATDFQLLNLRTAQIAYEAFRQSIGEELRREAAPHGPVLSSPQFALEVPGRAEVLRHSPTLMIDGANNPDGAQRLAKVLREAKSAQPSPKLTLVVSFSSDKDYEAMLQIWAPLCERLIVTQNTSPRAVPLDELQQCASKYFEDVEAVPSVPDAVQHALTGAAPGDLVCVCGSFFTIAEVPRGE